MTRNRSIGARSDWSAAATSNGDVDDGDDDDDDTDADPDRKTPNRTWSIYREDTSSNGVTKPGDDSEDPINRYVQDQLQRIRTNESSEMAEELASQNDGANDEL